MRHDQAMTRTTLIAVILAAACGLACVAAPAGALTNPHWSDSKCALQWSLFNVRHPHPNGLTLAGGNRTLKEHGCAQRVPGPKRWSNSECSDYQATFTKLYASPSNKQLASANGALKNHGCKQRVHALPQGY
jgi:hypothetical protein